MFFRNLRRYPRNRDRRLKSCARRTIEDDHPGGSLQCNTMQTGGFVSQDASFNGLLQRSCIKC